MTSRKTKLHQIHGIVGRHATLLNSDVTYPWKGTLEFSLFNAYSQNIINIPSLYVYLVFIVPMMVLFHFLKVLSEFRRALFQESQFG